jgi:hypothetical protein
VALLDRLGRRIGAAHKALRLPTSSPSVSPTQRK